MSNSSRYKSCERHGQKTSAQTPANERKGRPADHLIKKLYKLRCNLNMYTHIAVHLIADCSQVPEFFCVGLLCLVKWYLCKRETSHTLLLHCKYVHGKFIQYSINISKTVLLVNSGPDMPTSQNGSASLMSFPFVRKSILLRTWKIHQIVDYFCLLS